MIADVHLLPLARSQEPEDKWEEERRDDGSLLPPADSIFVGLAGVSAGSAGMEPCFLFYCTV